MITLQDGELLDLLPSQYKSDTEMICLSYALKKAIERLMKYEKDAMVMNFIDSLPEHILDVLAVEWNIPWYDSGYSIRQKREIVAKSNIVKLYMGSVSSVKTQIETVYPGTELEEWFEYSGDPGYFRLFLDVSGTSESEPAEEVTAEELERRFITAKKWSAHLESYSYMVKHVLKIKKSVDTWKHTNPFCGTFLCGTYPEQATKGYTQEGSLKIKGVKDGYAYTPMFCGTYPDVMTEGDSVDDQLLMKQAGQNIADGYLVRQRLCGTMYCGQ